MLSTLRPSGRHEGARLHSAVKRGGTGVDDAFHRHCGRRDGPCRRRHERGARSDVALRGGHRAAALPDRAERAGWEPRPGDRDDLPVGEARRRADGQRDARIGSRLRCVGECREHDGEQNQGQGRDPEAPPTRPQPAHQGSTASLGHERLPSTAAKGYPRKPVRSARPLAGARPPRYQAPWFPTSAVRPEPMAPVVEPAGRPGDSAEAARHLPLRARRAGTP